jgi:hypothetical protein
VRPAGDCLLVIDRFPDTVRKALRAALRRFARQVGRRPSISVTHFGKPAARGG